MGRISYSDDALDDLDDIYNYTLGKWDSLRANSYISGLRNVVDQIGTFPEIGNPRWSRLGEVRRFRYQSHYIVYRMLPAADIHVLRVVHVRRNLLDEEFGDPT